MSQIDGMKRAVYECNVSNGWRGPDSEPRTLGDEVALLHSECSEVLEAFRDFGTDDIYHYKTGETATDFIPDENGLLPKPEGIGSEAADILIRLLDFCVEYDIDIEAKFHEKLEYNATRGFRHGGKNL